MWQRWTCVVQASEQQRAGLVMGSVVQHQGWWCCEQWCLCSPEGKGFLCGTHPGWGEESVPGCASGLVSGFPWNKPQTTSVPLSVPFRTIWNIFPPTQNYLRIPCSRISESKDSETFPSALLWLIYNIESVYGVQLLIWHTSVLKNNHHHSFVWQLNHVTHYIFCMCGENLDLLS